MLLNCVRATAALALLTLGSCSSKPAEADAALLASSDFDNLEGWLADVPTQATLTREKAHSGKFSTQIGPEHEFSLSYNIRLSRLAAERPSRLTIGAWVLLPSTQAAAKLVAEVKNPGGTGPGLLWEGLDLPKAVKTYNEWQYVEQTITLPPSTPPESHLLVYLWRADSKEPVYLDDLTIKLAP